MKSLAVVLVAVIFALPLSLSAQAGNANSVAQNAPATSTSPTADTSATPQQPNTDSSKSAKVKAKKAKKVKKVKTACVSPPADSGLPDYCKNPYWDPKDWDYIRSNESPGNR